MLKLQVVRWRSIWYTISGLLIGGSILALGVWGLRQGIEFTGGSLLAVHFSHARPSIQTMEQAISNAHIDTASAVVQPVGDTDAQFRLPTLTTAQHDALMTSLKAVQGDVTELQFDTVGPVIGQELRQKSVEGLAIALFAIMIYVAYAFRQVSLPVQSWKYGIVTIITAFHDVIVPIGVFAILGHFAGVEIGTPFIAAILTILGYSITDTIVVMDRIRENLQKETGTFSEIVEMAVHQTFLRSFNTSAATLLTLFAIFFFGGASLRDFTLALIIGIATGTYSSIFIASPLLVSWEKWSRTHAAQAAVVNKSTKKK